MYNYLFFLIFLVLIGCGNNGDSDSNVYGIAQLGNLGDAEVKIYKIEENGSKTLKWTERTSEGKSLKSIGLFNSHSNELEDNVYYLYEIPGEKIGIAMMMVKKIGTTRIIEG